MHTPVSPIQINVNQLQTLVKNTTTTVVVSNVGGALWGEIYITGGDELTF